MRVHFDENNIHGMPRGKVLHCNIGDLYLETKDMEGVRLQSVNYIEYKGFEIHNTVFYAKDIISWHGTMAWNSFGLHSADVLRLINLLIKSGEWTAFEGPSTIYDKIIAGEQLNKEDLELL